MKTEKAFREFRKMKIDFSEQIKLTRWQLIQLILVCSALGAGATLIEPLLGLIVVGIAIIFFAMPIIQKIWENQTR